MIIISLLIIIGTITFLSFYFKNLKTEKLNQFVKIETIGSNGIVGVNETTGSIGISETTGKTESGNLNYSSISEQISYSDDERLMEQAFTFESIPSDCKEGSLIDIKLYDPVGVDPVIISKVEIVKRNANILSMYLNQEEQEKIKQSISEGSVYLLMYANKNQKPYISNYVPNYGGLNGR